MIDLDKIATEIQDTARKLIQKTDAEYVATLSGVLLLLDKDYFVYFHHNGNIYRIPKKGDARIDICEKYSDKLTMQTDILDIRHSVSIAHITGCDGRMSSIAVQKLCNRLKKKGDKEWQTCSRDMD